VLKTNLKEGKKKATNHFRESKTIPSFKISPISIFCRQIESPSTVILGLGDHNART
jgi:hypothetical protein